MELFSYKENVANIDGIDVYYKTAGKGSPLLILHGWGVSSLSWIKPGEMIASDSREVIIIDLPGFGQTAEPKSVWGNKDYANFVVNFVQQIGLEKFDILGHSFGGGVALRIAAEHGRMVDRLILCDAAIVRKERLGLRQKISKRLSKLGSKIISKTPLKPYFSKAAAALSGNYDYYKASPFMKRVFQKVVSEDLAFLLPQVDAPTLVVWGEKDQATPIEDAFMIAEAIRGSELKVITGAGHGPNKSQPQKLSMIINNFLSKK